MQKINPNLSDQPDFQPKLSRRGRPRGPSRKICLDAKVTFRCTPVEKLWMEEQARAQRMSLGDWIRKHLFA